MALKKFYKGTTTKLIITAQYKGGDPIDPANIDSFKIAIIVDGVIQAKFKYGDAEDGFEPLTVEESPKMAAYITREMSQKWLTGTATVQVLQQTTVAGFDDGFFDAGVYELFDVQEHKFQK